MREAGAPAHGGSCDSAHGGVRDEPGVDMVSPPTTLCNTERAQRESRAEEGSYTRRGRGQYKGRILHLASLQRGSLILREDCYNVVTKAPTLVTTSLYPTASERRECMLAMLFWVLAALAVVGALAIVWGLYLMARRWL